VIVPTAAIAMAYPTGHLWIGRSCMRRIWPLTIR